jgi:glycosyltransferase involved in cell wall biosynthesis
MPAAAKNSPIRVVHVLGAMNRGGVESWLMHVLRNIDREKFHLDFLVETDKPAVYDDEIRQLGSKILPCPHLRKPWTYARVFKQHLRENGPYHVVHSHVHHFSGFNLKLAYQAGVPIRVAHSHSDTTVKDAKSSFTRRQYLKLTEYWVHKYTTVGVAASAQAAVSLYGPKWQQDPRFKLLYCGIDLAPFKEAVDPATVRAEFGIPADAFVIGHVGRFSPQKNHAFLVEAAAEAIFQSSNARLLLVGEGPLKQQIEERVRQLGIEKQTIFAGGRSDIPRIMLGAMDVFLFPSILEGLGLVGIEAQAAGVPVVASDVIPKELDASPLVTRMSLNQSARQWADVILSQKKGPPDIQASVLASLMQGPFNIETSLRELIRVYSM